MKNKSKWIVLCFFIAMAGAAYTAEIKNVMVSQRWPWSRQVDISYMLDCSEGKLYDIEIEAFDGVVPLELPIESLSGDIFGVASGINRIVWDPTLTPYTTSGALMNFNVKLSLKQVPLYMIVDITDANLISRVI